MSGAGSGSRRGAAKRDAAPASTRAKSMEISSSAPIVINYSPFIYESGRPCAGCLDYHECKCKVEEAAAVAAAMKKSRSGIGSSSSEAPILESAEDDDAEEEEDAEENDNNSEDNNTDLSLLTLV